MKVQNIDNGKHAIKHERHWALPKVFWQSSSKNCEPKQKVSVERCVKGKKQKAKSRLTDSVIDKLQNYFGIALRSEVGAVLTSMFHIASEDSNYHIYCPKTSDSWCQYNRGLVNKTNLYKYGAGISSVQSNQSMLALTKESDLEKCLHGLTQNSNESFNATIWECASKSIYCGREVLELAVYDAVANYNYGRRAILDIFELLNMKP